MDSQRLEELFRYLQATSDAVTSKEYDLDSPLGYQPEHASISTDPVLNGLTQLGACRTNADRAFVSLIDQEHQFVVAEMTTSISMFDSTDHAENHGVCIGVRSLDLFAGICAGTMPAFTSGLPEDRPFINTDNVFANASRYVINDLSLEAKYAARPYVTGYPHMRYYAEVPIKSSSGFVLGTYAILDNKPRNGLNDENYRIMHETSRAIMQHLEMIKLREEHVHATRLLKGLSALIQDGPGSSSATLPSAERTKNLDSDPVEQNDINESAACHNTESLPDEQSISEPPVISRPVECCNNDMAVARSCNPSSSTEDKAFGTNQLPEKSAPVEAKPSGEVEIADPVEDDSQNSKDDATNTVLETTETIDASGKLFTYAADLLRHTMKLEGVVFLDPAPNRVSMQADTKSVHSIGQAEHLRASPKHVRTESAAARSIEQLHHKDIPSKARFSRIFGCSVKHSNRAILLPESTHQELLESCSSGRVFNLTRTSHVSSPSLQPSDSTNLKGSVSKIQEMEAVIRWYIPAARSIMFIPLWNPHTGKWFAGGLGWSTQYKRVLTSSDLSYFAAFGNTLMAEVARLELLAIDRAKSDFISCMSHELRSPLHGILGSTEMLLDSVADDDQRQYVSMIGKCGHILLETMENILQFSKINQGVSDSNLVGERNLNGRRLSDAEARVSGAESDLDLSALIEETCEVLVAGKSGAIHTTTMNHLQPYQNEPLSDSSVSTRTSCGQPVTVVLQIDPTCSKFIRSSSAAWRRCLLNLLGNSLKYTEAGYVYVELNKVTEVNDSALGLSQPVVALSVRDTGRGIGKAYLESRLFRPFEQENTFSSGTGLGLSIVKSLVDDLQGSVDIQSEPGVGTKVVLSIPVRLAHEAQAADQDLRSYVDLKVCLLGFGMQDCLKSTSNGANPVIADRDTIIERSLILHFQQWLGMTYSFADKITAVEADIVAILESNLHLLRNELDRETLVIPAGCSLLVLCSDHHIHHHLNDHEHKGRVAFISQPFGPRKLATIIEGFHKYRAAHTPRFEDQIEIDLEILRSTSDQGRPNKKTTPSTTLPASPLKRTKLTHNSNHENDPIPHTTPSPQSIQIHSLKHLLLVDDNPINLKLLVQVVQKLSCTYKVATDGLEALNIYKTSPKHFDYIFMDISMPVMDGFESTRAIRAIETEENRSSTCIIAMTGLGSEDARNRAFTSGVSMFWTKPVKLKDIKALIEADNVQLTARPQAT